MIKPELSSKEREVDHVQEQLEAADRKLGPFARIILKPGKAKIVQHGARVVFSGAIDRELKRHRPMAAGDTVVICDEKARPLAWGIYNPHSQIFRIRVLQNLRELGRAPQHALDVRAYLEAKLQAAIALREACGLPSADTNAYRLCNSEGDGISGLTIDALGDCLVVQSSAFWIESNRQLIEELLRKLTKAKLICWRPQWDLLQKEEGLPTPQTRSLEDYQGPEELVICERGVQYYASVKHGQKTGFYADQRESRHFLRSLSHGKRVLDLCCYTGGFAINAALAGASQVVGVDSSEPALELARRNASLNGLGERLSFVKADVSQFMEEQLASGQEWDLIILDPPKLAPSRKHMLRAQAKYRKLNQKAMRLLKPGGILMSCSCSGAMTQSGGFLPMLQDSARNVDRSLTLLRHAGGGFDHTLDPAYPEGEYLTNMTVRVL